MRLAAALLTLAALASPAFAGPPSVETLDSWIRDLDDDDAGKRDAAEKNLATAGEDAYARVKAALEAGKAGAEGQERLKRVIAGVEHARAWVKTWNENPIALAEDFVKDERCGTCRQNRVPYRVYPIQHEALPRRFPDLRFFVLDWDCCQDKPIASHVLAVARAADVRIQLWGEADWRRKLAPYILPVKTAEEARETASLLLSLSHQKSEFEPPATVVATNGKAEERDGTFRVTIPFGWKGQPEAGYLVTFDREGRLAEIGETGR